MSYRTNLNASVKMKCGNWKNPDNSIDSLFMNVSGKKMPLLPTFFCTDFSQIPISVVGKIPDWYLDNNGKIVNAVLWQAYPQFNGVDFAVNQI